MTRGGPGLARPLLILALAGLLGACSAPQSRDLVDARPPDLAPAATVADVPFVPSTETLCRWSNGLS